MFAVLNDDGPSLPKSILESRELQLEAALSQYLHGLEFQRQLDLVGARDVYKALLRLPIMKEPLAHVSDSLDIDPQILNAISLSLALHETSQTLSWLIDVFSAVPTSQRHFHKSSALSMMAGTLLCQFLALTIEFYDDDSEEKPSLVQMHIDDTKSCQTVVGNGSSTPQIQFAPTKRSRQENTRTSDRVRQKIEEASGKKGLSPNGLLILNPFLPAELKLDVDIVLLDISTNTPLPSVVAVLLKMSDHVPLETSPHFSDASIVSRFVKSLGQSATIQTIASRFIIDSVVGNDFLEKAIIYDFQWPMGFDSVIIRLLSLLEELGVHTHNLILYRPDISDDSDKTLEFLVILAEAIIDHCESQLSPSSASDPPEEYFGNDNSLLETTFTSILARLLGSIDSTPQRIFDLHPKILIRALWLKTRYIYATQSFSSASESLERLQEIVVSTFSKIVLECDSKSVRLSNSDHCGTVQSFMDLVSANQLIDNIQEHHRHLRHNKVVDLLVPILFPDLHLSGEYPEKLSDSICHAARHLISSCATTWSHLEYLECLQKAILELKRPHMLEHILPALLRHYLLTIISGEDTEDVITSKIKYFQDNTTPLVLLMTKVAWQLMVSVSDDDSVSVLLKQSDDARNIIGNIVVRSWILLLSSSQLYNRVSNMDTKPRRTVSSTSQNGFTIKEIIKCTPEIISSEEDNDEDDSDDDSNDSAERDENDIHRETSFSRSDKRLVKMMSWIHDQLGDICLCGSAEGAYLRHVLGILTKLEYSKYYVYVNQCYACLYDVIIKLDRQTIYEHDCTPFKFEETAATEAFKLVSPYILDKLSKGMYRAITYDIRVCFEQIAGVLGDISLHNVHVQHNRNLINAYLESHIDPGVANPARKQMCGILPLECSSRIPDVFRSLFFVGGGIVWAQYNAKWANSFKGQEAYDELELAVVLLMKHVSIEPEDAGAWIILGQCQCALADELLNWSAIRIIESKKTIAQHQKKAFNSLLRASKLIQDPGRCSVPSADLRLALWKSLGHISCSIAGKPMAGESLLPNLYRIKEIWKSRSVDLAATNTDSEESASSNSVGRQLLHLMGVSIYSMQKALLIDPSDWRLHYSIAIAHVKLGNTSKAIKELFVATTLSAKENRSKEPDRVLEPLIKLMDVLALALYKKNISVMGHSTVFHTEDPTQASDPFQLISSALSVIKSMDKKKWQHKPIYRQAWILFNIRHDAAAAKLELLQLFQLRSNSISMKSIWKTEPGKFFVYIHKYALFLIKLAAATLDSVVLRQLYRRISKTEDVCLDRNHLLSEIRRAFCEMVAPTLPDNKKVLWTCKFVQQGDCRHVIERAENSIFADFNLEVESVAGRMLFAAELKREKVADLISLILLGAYNHLSLYRSVLAYIP
ncbi:hypothetical protein BSLG_003822 [Batrachochytrium salamandrivorans]|nr:hypothetical protein BSLG_003822 [Batrachochytrium salamandrivorans]